MNKVVTEKPRSGGRIKAPKGEKRQLAKFGEDQPKREKIRQKWKRAGWEKEFTDVIGPLYGYLKKQVGRPWNKVYSELSKILPKGSVQNNHIYTHVFQIVEKDVEMVDGIPCYKAVRFYRDRYGVPIESSGNTDSLFIHPVTGILCKAKRKRKKKYTPQKWLPGIQVYQGLQYHKLQDGWYEVKVKRFLPGVMEGSLKFEAWSNNIEDPILDRHYKNIETLIKIYGGRYIATSKRKLSKNEAAKAHLTPIVQNVVR